MLSLWRPPIRTTFRVMRLRPTFLPHLRPRPGMLLCMIALGAPSLALSLALIWSTRTFTHHRPIGLPVRFTVSWCRADLELVQLIPLFIGAIPFRDGKKFANPATRINRLWIVHTRIMNYTTRVIQHSREMNCCKTCKTPDFDTYSDL